MAFPREWLHNHFLGIRDVKMQINSRDRRSPFFRVAASSNIAFQGSRNSGAAAVAANRLEALKGDRKGQWSIRINNQWRVCFKFSKGDAYVVEITDYH